jgi:hypothetical protein
LNSVLFPALGSPARTTGRLQPHQGLVGQLIEEGECPVDPVQERCACDEFEILVDKVQSGLEVCQDEQQVLMDLEDLPRQPPAHLFECDPEFVLIGRVDHAEDRFGLHQIDAAREKGPERELAALRRTDTLGIQGLKHSLQQRRRAEQVQLREGLAGVTATGWPEQHVHRQRGPDAGDGQRPGMPPGTSDLCPLREVVGSEEPTDDGPDLRAAHPDDPPGGRAGGRCQRGNQVVHRPDVRGHAGCLIGLLG